MSDVDLHVVAGVENRGEWDQTFALRLGCGDYIKGEVERYGTRSIISLGHVSQTDSSVIEWGWSMPISPADLHNIVERLAIHAYQISERTNGVISQAHDKIRQLEERHAETTKGVD